MAYPLRLDRLLAIRQGLDPGQGLNHCEKNDILTNIHNCFDKNMGQNVENNERACFSFQILLTIFLKKYIIGFKYYSSFTVKFHYHGGSLL